MCVVHVWKKKSFRVFFFFSKKIPSHLGIWVDMHMIWRLSKCLSIVTFYPWDKKKKIEYIMNYSITERLALCIHM